ncbi:hypothetical protein [Streptomyces sp. SP17KL33]|uniref:hypothetical protein n=1 Tax=Streptomyces sp. SP17KL33 TaxID=3002534 RepID=UPI002E786751|nr:hypothetical protein [Streptomyces sp. SP17KL33]MEE1835785.1 hypothetical protein [Streptomyces sp. SP17KL33]
MSEHLVMTLPAVGTLVLDTATDRVGVFMGRVHPHSSRVWLRPEGGGREWEAFGNRLKAKEVKP